MTSGDNCWVRLLDQTSGARRSGLGQIGMLQLAVVSFRRMFGSLLKLYMLLLFMSFLARAMISEHHAAAGPPSIHAVMPYCDFLRSKSRPP